MTREYTYQLTCSICNNVLSPPLRDDKGNLDFAIRNKHLHDCMIEELEHGYDYE